MNLVFVIGMARTGTSAVTGLVKAMGADSPPQNVAGVHNVKYHENIVVNALAESIHPWHKVTEKDTNPHLTDAMAAYLAEYTFPGSTMVVKSPAFPFIIPELWEVCTKVRRFSGFDVNPYYIVTHRNPAHAAASADKFTMRHFGEEHWAELYQSAQREIDRSLADDCLHVDYEYLVSNWKLVAQEIQDYIPGLKIPVEAGIDPTLNHEGMRHAG